MSHSQDGNQSTLQDHATAPMAAAAPLPTIRDTSRGPADVQRLPSLTELFPDKWQPENAPVQREYYPGARGPRDFPGPPSIAPSPLLSARGREVFPPVQAPPSLSPSSQQHSPALSGRTAPLLPPMQQASEPRGLPTIYGQNQPAPTTVSATSQPPTIASPRDMDPRGYPIGGPPPGSHSPYYAGGMPPRDFGPPMPPPPPPGYQTGHHGPYASMIIDGGDFGDSKKQGGRRRGNLPKQVTDILRMWFQDHVAHPYPTEEEKQALMHQTGLSISQISNWFINARRRSLPRMNGQGQTDADLN